MFISFFDYTDVSKVYLFSCFLFPFFVHINVFKNWYTCINLCTLFSLQGINIVGPSNADPTPQPPSPAMYQLDIVLKKGNNLAIRDRTGRSSDYSSCYLTEVRFMQRDNMNSFIKPLSSPPNERSPILVSVHLSQLFCHWHKHLGCVRLHCYCIFYSSAIFRDLYSISHCLCQCNIFQCNIFLCTIFSLFSPILFFSHIYLPFFSPLSLLPCRVLLNHTSLPHSSLHCQSVM